jgi:alkaline phosphatase D
MSFNDYVSRRKFLKSAGLLLGVAAVPWSASRAANAASSVRLAAANGPQLEQGIQIGDVRAHRAVIWSRSDRPARMLQFLWLPKNVLILFWYNA